MREIVIDKPAGPFDDSTDFTRGNSERKPYGKSESTNQFHVGKEFDVVPSPEAKSAPPEAPTQRPTTAQVTPPGEEFPFTHKLANGTELKAKTAAELAQQIEKVLTQAQQTTVEFDDEPLYKPKEFKRRELSLQEQADLLNLAKEKPQEAQRKWLEAELGTPLDELLNQLSRSEQRELNQREKECGVDWILENVDSYNPTPENGKKLTQYLRENAKPITKKNLTAAYNALRDQLTPLPAATAESEEPPLNPPTIIPSNVSSVHEETLQPSIDPAKFAAMSLKEQQAFFAKLRSGTR